MKTKLRTYKPEQDFDRIRDFLMETYQMSGRLINWRIERWNYARYFVAPFLGAYGSEHSNVEGSQQAIRFWEDTVGVWENGTGEITGVVNIEHPVTSHPDFGEVFFQRHPQYEFLLDEMLDYAEENLANKEKNRIVAFAYDYDGAFHRGRSRTGDARLLILDAVGAGGESSLRVLRATGRAVAQSDERDAVLGRRSGHRGGVRLARYRELVSR
jgi:hypothetical protein